jgi:hypothetical protein
MEVLLKVHLVDPPPGVWFRLQTKKGDLLEPLEAAVAYVDGDWRGPLVHGRPGERFLYVNSGQSAGQPGSPWKRRAKVPLAGLTDPAPVSVARIDGCARDGGPCCASVAVTWETAK